MLISHVTPVDNQIFENMNNQTSCLEGINFWYRVSTDLCPITVINVDAGSQDPLPSPISLPIPPHLSIHIAPKMLCLGQFILRIYPQTPVSFPELPQLAFLHQGTRRVHVWCSSNVQFGDLGDAESHFLGVRISLSAPWQFTRISTEVLLLLATFLGSHLTLLFHTAQKILIPQINFNHSIHSFLLFCFVSHRLLFLSLLLL